PTSKPSNIISTMGRPRAARGAPRRWTHRGGARRRRSGRRSRSPPRRPARRGRGAFGRALAQGQRPEGSGEVSGAPEVGPEARAPEGAGAPPEDPVGDRPKEEGHRRGAAGGRGPEASLRGEPRGAPGLCGAFAALPEGRAPGGARQDRRSAELRVAHAAAGAGAPVDLRRGRAATRAGERKD